MEPRQELRDVAPDDAAALRKQDRKFVVALGRGLSILEALAAGETWLASGTLAARVGLPRPTVSRLLQSLVQDGYVHYSERRRQYRLGLGVVALGQTATGASGAAQLVQPYLRYLADTFNVHASLAGRDRLDAVQIEVCHSTTTLMTLQLDVGSRIPLAGTATGHALLATLPEEELELLYGHLSRRHAKHWHEIRARIEEARAEHAARGYTTSRHGWMTDINGVAAALPRDRDGAVLALSCGAPARHLPRAKMEVIGQELKRISGEIAAGLADS